jgi:hypothetical protein
MVVAQTILLKGSAVHDERLANAAITPGYLIEVMSTGKVRKHATAGGNVFPRFAFDNMVDDIDTDYAANDTVIYGVPERGANIYALLPAAAAAVVIGDLLESNGDGTLRKHDPQDQPEENGLYDIATLAISATAEKFKTTTTAAIKIDGVQYTKSATDNLTFTAAHAVTANKFGIILIQMNAAGTISTKVPGATQAYNTALLALAALPDADANNVALGYIAIANNAGDWTANTDDLTDGSDLTTATFVNATPVAVNPTAIVQNGIVGMALEAVDNSLGASEARIRIEVI